MFMVMNELIKTLDEQGINFGVFTNQCLEIIAYH